MKILIGILLAITLISLQSCGMKLVNGKKLNCDTVPVYCNSRQFMEIPIDTNRVSKYSSKGKYLSINLVQGLEDKQNVYTVSSDQAKHLSILTDTKFFNNTYQRAEKHAIIENDLLSFREKLEYNMRNKLSHFSYAASHEKHQFIAGIIDYNDLAGYTNGIYENYPLMTALGRSRIYQIDGMNIKRLLPELPLIEYWEGNPALDPSGRYLYFASDMPGGFGGTDIWYLDLTESTPIPRNCGDMINSACDEFSPWIDGTSKYLYFASNAHGKLNKYDIVRSNIIKHGTYGELSKFTNPLNQSTSNEISIYCPGDCDTLAYFTSDRSGLYKLYVMALRNLGQEYDHLRKVEEVIPTTEVVIKQDIKIADFETKEPEKVEQVIENVEPVITEVKPEVEPIEIEIKDLQPVIIPQTTVLDGKIVDAKQNPIENVELTLKSKDNLELDKQNSDKQGKFEFVVKTDEDLKINVFSEKHFSDEKYISKEQLQLGDKLQVYVKLDEIYILRLNFPYNEFKEPYQNILDSNGIETNISWQSQIDLIANNIIRISDKLKYIDLVGHTDYIGGDSYNMNLGQNRVNFLRDELIKRGVSKNKIKTSSKGKSQPLEKRANEDDETFRKRCRRVTLEKVFAK